MRDAADGAAFAEELVHAAGVPVESLPAEREAHLAYAAAPAAGPRLVVDIGGRTTELTRGHGDDILDAVSLPLGALALTEAFLHTDPPTGAECARLMAEVDAALAGTAVPARARAAAATMTAAGGTATALAALDLGLVTHDPRRVHGHVLPTATLRALADRLATMAAAARVVIGPLDTGRAAILPAGAVVLARVAAAAGAERVLVSEHGVRHAYLRERLAAQGVVADLSRLWA
jgi:exopolyphosphatase/guanosine-5'-triphosphate,3'-diphosphate pyrophosphatase